MRSLLSVLYSLAAARHTIFITNRKKGLAKLASISRSQVDVSLARLKKVGVLAIGAILGLETAICQIF